MRSPITLPLLAVALSLSVPAMAQDRNDDSEIVEKLNDPVFQDNMVTMMSGLMGAMMELPVGPFVTAIEQAVPADMQGDAALSGIAPDATLGDLARGDDPDFDRNIEDKMRKGTAMMGLLASEFGALLPQLKAIGERVKNRMEEQD